jgi:TIR domain-containing protein
LLSSFLLEVFTMPETDPATPLTERKPLVFLSASREDEEWREGLRKRLNRYADYFEWWDDSRVGTGENWKEQVESAIQRTNVAVVFLSGLPGIVYGHFRTGIFGSVCRGQQVEVISNSS